MKLQPKAGIHYFVKLLMLGDSGVGKSCLMMRFSDGTFPLDIIGTAGIDCKEKVIAAGDKSIRVQIWDTAGQERYSTLTDSYYKKAFGIMLVYDTTDIDSFESVNSWLKSIKEKGNSVVEVVLVGNKTDLVEERKISTVEGRKLADAHKIPFIETSAKNDKNVTKAFGRLIENVLRNKILAGHCIPDKMVKVSVSKEQTKSTCP